MEQTATTSPASGAHTAAAPSSQPARRDCERTAASPHGLVRKIGALAWTVAPPLVLSALLHSTDAGIGGIAGLARPGVPLSVAVWAAPMVVLALLTLWTRVRAGVPAALVTAAVAAVVPGWFILLLGSSAATPLARLGSFLGLTALCLAAIGLAALPAAAIGWPARRSAHPCSPAGSRPDPELEPPWMRDIFCGAWRRSAGRSSGRATHWR